MNDNIDEFELEFSDLTIIEADGSYDEVKRIMVDEPKSWMLRTQVGLSSYAGYAQFILHMYHNGEVYIMDYGPSAGDMYYNPDIRCISLWAQDNGWKIPKPNIDLVKENVHFWKHFWETFLIDCDYLDGRFGERISDIAEDKG